MGDGTHIAQLNLRPVIRSERNLPANGLREHAILVRGMEVSATSNLDVIPARIGRYRILTRVAAGGMGTVYLAKTKQADGSELQVALKVLHPHLAQEEEVARRFIDEGRVGSRIAHPNVVAVHDAGQADGTSYLALEYVHGDTLSALMRATVSMRKKVPVGIATSILLDLLAGLHA
ncbi:MAG: hypothetical protein EOP08_13515, partial [Proteobacteria bacterium]